MPKKRPAPLSASTSPVATIEEPSRGRPPGAKNISVEAIVDVSRCPQCGSTEREKYSNPTEMEQAGTFKGQAFTHIVWRSTRCLTCGQSRRDRTYENRIETIG